MNIVVDEDIPRRTVLALQASNHNVIDIRGTAQEGVDDSTLWNFAQSHKALLITTDKGFARFRNESHWGILIIRLRQPNCERIHRRVIQTVNQFSSNK